MIEKSNLSIREFDRDSQFENKLDSSSWFEGKDNSEFIVPSPQEPKINPRDLNKNEDDFPSIKVLKHQSFEEYQKSMILKFFLKEKEKLEPDLIYLEDTFNDKEKRYETVIKKGQKRLDIINKILNLLEKNHPLNEIMTVLNFEENYSPKTPPSSLKKRRKSEIGIDDLEGDHSSKKKLKKVKNFFC